MRSALRSTPLFALSLAAASTLAAAARADVTATLFPFGPTAPDGSGAYCAEVPLVMGFQLTANPSDSRIDSLDFGVSVNGNPVQSNSLGGGGDETGESGFFTFEAGGIPGSDTVDVQFEASGAGDALLADTSTTLTFESCGCSVPFQVSAPFITPGDSTPLVCSDNYWSQFYYTLQPGCAGEDGSPPDVSLTFTDADGSIETDSITPQQLVPNGGALYYVFPSNLRGPSNTLTFTATSRSDGTVLGASTVEVAVGNQYTPGCGGGTIAFDFDIASAPSNDGSGSWCSQVPLLLGYTAHSSGGSNDYSQMSYTVSYGDPAIALDEAGAQGGGSSTDNAGYVTSSALGDVTGQVPITLDAFAQDENNAFLAGGTASFPFEECGCDNPLSVAGPLGQDPESGAGQLCGGSQAAFFWTVPPSCLPAQTNDQGFSVSYVNSSGATELVSGLSVSPVNGAFTGGWIQFDAPQDASGQVTLTFTLTNLDSGAVIATQTLTASAGDCSGGGSQDLIASVCVPDGMEMFEDNWPGNGDLDFNDQVVAYNYQFLYDLDLNTVSEMLATFNVLAIGASFHNGLYLHLAGVPASSDVSITLTRSDGQVLQGTPIAGEDDLVIEVVGDTRELFPSSPAGFINTDPTLPAAQGLAISVDLQFHDSSGQILLYGPIISATPIDLFIARTGSYGHQIHLPVFPGTQLADTSLYQTDQDDSAADGRGTPGIYYVNQDNLPFALDVPVTTAWPTEKTDVGLVFTTLSAFAGGNSAADWYEQGVDTTDAFLGGAGGTPLPQLLAPVAPLQGLNGACAPNAFGGSYSTRAPHPGR